MAYEKDYDSQFPDSSKVGLATPLIDADGSMARTQPALDGELPFDPMNYTGKSKKEK
jgi:hypothetical protein